VCFHATPTTRSHTGGVMRLAADAGHRVVLVTATDGALGEVPKGLLAEASRLVDRRRRELETSARALGVHRLELLGYPDSGMAGTPTTNELTHSAMWTSRSPRRGWRGCWSRREPTCSPSTTHTATTATRTTSSPVVGVRPRSSRGQPGLRGQQ